MKLGNGAGKNKIEKPAMTDDSFIILLLLLQYGVYSTVIEYPSTIAIEVNDNR